MPNGYARPEKAKKESASKILANKCKSAISEDIAMKYGWYYVRDEETRDQWRTLLPFRADVEEYATGRACYHLAMLSGVGAKARNPEFLKSVLKDIAKYLARYSMKNPAYLTQETIETPEDSPEVISKKRSKKRELTMAHLLNILLNQNEFLAKIKLNQAETQAKKRGYTTAQIQHHKKTLQQERLKTRREIDGVFRDAAKLKKK